MKLIELKDINGQVKYSCEANDEREAVEKAYYEDGVELTNLDFSGTNLRGLHLEFADLSGSKFCGTNLSEAFFGNCELKDTDFTKANLEKSTIKHSNTDRAKFVHVKHLGMKFITE